jgi:tripartite-type tricarboxylate transporter receptor subunit TctC
VYRSSKLSLLFAATAALFIAPFSSASALEDGDTVRIVVGFSPGGGYDSSARLAAPYFEAALRERGFPKVSVIVENVTGGAGVMGAATVFSSPPDGTTVGILEPMDATWQELILGAPFKVTDFTFLAQQNTETYGLMIRSDLKITDIDQLAARSKEKPILLGTAGRTSYSTRIFPVLVQETLARAGVNVKFAFVNMSGTSDARASISRGEAEGLLMGVSPSSITFVKEGHANFLFSFQDDEWPDAKDVLKLPPELFDPLSGAAVSRRLYIAPPGMDEKLTKTFRDAFQAVFTNAEFIEKSKTAGFPVSFLSGDDTRTLIIQLAEFAKANKDVVQKSVSSGQ